MSCQFGLALEPGRQVASVIAESRSVGAHALSTTGGKGPGFRKIRLGIGLGLRAAAEGLKTCGERIEYGRSRLEACFRAVAEHHPDVCLLDLYLPERENGLQAAQVIRRSHPDTLILIMSGVADPLILSRAIDIGV